MKATLHTIPLLAGLALAANGWAQEGNYEAITREDISKVSKPQYSPYAGRSFPTRVLWGDTHLHTAVSVDAGTMCRVGQEDAYRFARSEEITTTHGLRARLSRPLDFLVISDHAEMCGLMPQLLSGDPEVLATEKGKKWYQELQSGDTERAFATAMAAVEEDNFFGKHSGVEPEPHRWEHVVIEAPDPKFTIHGWQQAAGGYAAVWATENTREAIFDAMKRKEACATTSPRMVVRFFGGWNFTSEDARTRMPAAAGYTRGVPMGGDLHTAPKGRKPTFLVAAMKDPYSGNLDRIQIIKGWLDRAGETHERIYDVAWGGDRIPGADEELPPVGNTVNVEKAIWSNTIGAPELIQVWTDPDFDASQPAFYYPRVIEIPTPRWTAYEAQRFGIKMSPEVPMTTQERAYTSPIWYNP